MPRTKSFDQQEILDKATELFWEKGYSATSVNDLVEYLNLNRSSLYNSFGDKYDLFIQSLERYADQGLEHFEQKISVEGSAKDVIRKIFEGFGKECNSSDKKGCFMINSAVELSASDPAVKELVSRNRKFMQAKFEYLLRRGIENGELKQDLDTEAIAAFLYNAYIGLITLGTTGIEAGEITKVIDTTLSVLD